MDLENILATQFQRAEQSLAERDRRSEERHRIILREMAQLSAENRRRDAELWHAIAKTQETLKELAEYISHLGDRINGASGKMRQ